MVAASASGREDVASSSGKGASLSVREDPSASSTQPGKYIQQQQITDSSTGKTKIIETRLDDRTAALIDASLSFVSRAGGGVGSSTGSADYITLYDCGSCGSLFTNESDAKSHECSPALIQANNMGQNHAFIQFQSPTLPIPNSSFQSSSSKVAGNKKNKSKAAKFLSMDHPQQESPVDLALTPSSSSNFQSDLTNISSSIPLNLMSHDESSKGD